MLAPDPLLQTDATLAATTSRRDALGGSWPGYAIATALGAVAAFIAVPWVTLIGTGRMFQGAAGDLAVNLLGHLAFQTPGWHWPILRAPELGWPNGASIAMTDSNPALSLVAKLIAGVVGHPVNLFGIWLAACLVLQPVGAVYAMRGLQGESVTAAARNQLVASVAASVAALLLPGFLFRIGSTNLFGHFLLLMALGWAARLCVRGKFPAVPRLAGFLTLTAFVHPYLFMFAAVTLAAPALQALVQRRAGAREALRGWMLATLIPIGAFMLGSFTLGGGGPGFGLYSTNVLSPVWPQISGIFGAGLPILDATGYQREGFNYLGAGVLVLLACAAWVLAQGGGPAWRSVWRHLAGVVVSLGLLAALAITPHVTIGKMTLLNVDVAVLDRLLAAMRSSGRAVWVVDYGLLLGAIGVLAARWSPRVFVPVVATALVLQWVDAGPLRAQAVAYLAGGEAAPAVTLPAGTRLFRAVYLCADDAVAADRYRLAAFRAGIHLAEMRLAHPPLAADCAAMLAEGLNAPLAPGETRLFLTSIAHDLKQERLGAGVSCAPSEAGVMCYRPEEASVGGTVPVPPNPPSRR
jgi:hypothetical protein